MKHVAYTHRFSVYAIPLYLLLSMAFLFPLGAHASQTQGTIDSTLKYAWSDNAGWINFGASTGNVQVTDAALTGYAWSSTYGWINLNPAQGGITNTSAGLLSGFAWGESLGWIDFSGVSIDGTGHFHGAATGSLVGTLTFDCTNCAVVTDWRPLSDRSSTPPISGGGSGHAVSSGIPGLPPTGSCTYLSTNHNPDITRDGRVDLLDFNALMVAWGTGGAESADITHDCAVDLLDFNALMVGWSA